MAAFLLCSLSPELEPDHPVSANLRADALGAGLAVTDLSPRTWLGVSGPGAPSVLAVGAWTMIGDVFNRREAPLGRVSDTDALAYEKKLIARFWGRFVGVRLGADGALAAILRDPSGALDCLWWTCGPLTLAASEAPEWLVRAATSGWRISAPRVEAVLHDPYAASGDLMVEGPTPVLPGGLHDVRHGAASVLWRPDWIARGARPVSDEAAAAALRNAVDETVAGVARLGGGLAAEVSGGLDSSIVAASIARTDRDRVRLWLNAWGPDASADERPWVEALATRLGVAAATVPRATGRLTRSSLEAISQGVRPGFAALDGLHDADWARRFQAAGVDAVVTGKGGDSMFVQPADIGVFVDLFRARGWRAILSRDLVRLARWNERSVWSLIAQARRPDWRPNAIDAPNGLLAAPPFGPPQRHPWMTGLGGLGPAKRRQILGLVQGLGLHGPSLQTAVVSVLHPLLMQPVVEACLALPTWQLTLGTRDRALARRAFRDRLPDVIVDRRSKGEMTAFYGRLIADSLDVLRPWLLDGRLAAMGLIDRPGAEAILTRESLAWRGGYVDIMVTAAMESWVRTWERRLPGA